MPTNPEELARRLRPVPFWTHKRVSYLKSVVRIVACVGALFITNGRASLIVLAAGLAVAEWLGILEEVGIRGE